MQSTIKLGSRHRLPMAAHLISLSEDDRCDRFLAVVSDDAVRRYVDGIAYARDILVGCMHEHRLVGLAHAAVYLEQGELIAEVGISVDGRLRRGGLGRRLLLAAMDSATRFGVVRVEVIFRSQNRAMSALTRSLGGRVVPQGSESSAVFTVNVAGGLALQTTTSASGREVVGLHHPHERGRALLVHGAGGDSFQWLSRVAPALWAAGYSVHAPTLPGHGRHADPAQARLDDLQACVSDAADDFAPTLLVGHSMGGYLVQRHRQTRPVARTLLLASLPPRVPRERELDQAISHLDCPLAQAVAQIAMADAPDLEPQSADAGVLVIGGERDPVVSKRWVRHTAAHHGVEARFVPGGHRLMSGRAAGDVMRLLAAEMRPDA